jgi:hypothetical protein
VTELVECSFLVPVNRNDGTPQPGPPFMDLEDFLLSLAGGFTGPNCLFGAWVSASGRVQRECSVEYRVTLGYELVPVLVSRLQGAASIREFDQESIYLRVGTQVSFVRPATEKGSG